MSIISNPEDQTGFATPGFGKVTAPCGSSSRAVQVDPGTPILKAPASDSMQPTLKAPAQALETGA